MKQLILIIGILTAGLTARGDNSKLLDYLNSGRDSGKKSGVTAPLDGVPSTYELPVPEVSPDLVPAVSATSTAAPPRPKPSSAPVRRPASGGSESGLQRDFSSFNEPFPPEDSSGLAETPDLVAAGDRGSPVVSGTRPVRPERPMAPSMRGRRAARAPVFELIGKPEIIMPEGAGQEVLASWVVKPLADYTLDIVVPLGGISYKAKTGAYILAPVIERGGMTVRQGSLEWMREAAKRQRALVGELRHMLGRVRGAVPSSGADGTREADVHAR